jgi:uracil-DNA glycosylase
LSRSRAARQDDLASWIASAREWLGEFSEEGVERVAVMPVTTAVAAQPTPPAENVRGTEFRPVGLFEERTVWSQETTLASVRADLGDCKRCRLCEQRTQIVFGDGNPNADLMFIGEGPGAEEDRTGLPFVGRAGELLTAMIEKGLEIPRHEVYICNIVKCRPPGNRTPLADEAGTCSVFLDGQIAAVRPKVIVALGKPATSLLLGREVSITRVRGTWHAYKGIPLMPTFHPAFVLRKYTAENRRAVWSDLRAAVARIGEG